MMPGDVKGLPTSSTMQQTLNLFNSLMILYGTYTLIRRDALVSYEYLCVLQKTFFFGITRIYIYILT